MAPITLPLFELSGLARRKRKLEGIGSYPLKLLDFYSPTLSTRWKTIKVGKNLGGSAEIVVSSTNNPADLPKTTNNAVDLMLLEGTEIFAVFARFPLPCGN